MFINACFFSDPNGDFTLACGCVAVLLASMGENLANGRPVKSDMGS